MSQRYTHIIEIYPEKEERVMVAPQKVELQTAPARYVLSRWDTGLIIGMAQGKVLNVIDLTKESNTSTTYRDDKFAQMALKKYADADARKEYQEPHAFIEEVDMDKKVLKPNLGDIAQINRVK